jgi:hypothetical protein
MAEPNSPTRRVTPLRTTVAGRLRAFADRVQPLPMPNWRPTAPLVRLGGRWWYRGKGLGTDADDAQQ